MFFIRTTSQSVGAIFLMIFSFLNTVSAQNVDHISPQAKQPIMARLTFQSDHETDGPVIDARLNNQANAHLLLDTGSNSSVLSSSMAARLGLPPQPLTTDTGKPFLFNGKSARFVFVSTHLGELVFNVPYIVLPDAQIRADKKSNVDGIVGMNAMSVASVCFDFPHKQVTLFYPHDLTPEQFKQLGMDNATLLPNTSNIEFLCFVPVTLNGRVHTDAVIDTGTPDTDLPAKVLAPLQLKPLRRNIPFSNMYGNIKENLVQVDTFDIGSLALSDQPVYTWDHAPEGTQPHIGMDVLSRCRLLIDYTAKTLYLKSVTQANGVAGSQTAQIPARIAATMPLEALPGSSFPCVRLTLDDGKPYQFVLDLSAAFSPLDRSIAEQTKLPLRAEKDETGKPIQALRTFVHPTTLSSVVPAGAGFPNLQVPFTVSDLTNFRSAYPQSAGGLGVNFLQASAWHLDFGRQQLTMLFPSGLAGTPEEPKGATRVPLQKKNGVLYVQGTVDGKPAEFVLDSENTVLQSGETLAALQPVGRLQQIQQADGKPDAQTTVRLHELKIGDILWKQPVVKTMPREDKRAPNLIGLDLLRRYRITIDPASQSLYLEPDPAYKEPEDKIGLGFTPHVNADKNLEIVSLYLPSPASEAGLKVGDVITSINGLPVQTTPIQQVAAQVQHKPEGTVITLVVLSTGADRPREVTLKIRKLL